MSKLKMASILLIFSTFFLKFSSMVRDLFMSHYFGASSTVDAYVAAMNIPNMIILFMLTGMKDAFLPSYVQQKKNGLGKEHLTDIVKGTIWICLIFSIIGMLISPMIIRLAFPDFNSEAITIAIWTSILYFASLTLVGVNAVYEGFFDAERKFSLSTFSQTSVVLTTILFTIFFHHIWGIYALPIGYVVGTLFSLMFKVFYLKPVNMINWKQKISLRDVRSFYLIFLPIGLTSTVGQINLFINNIFASHLGEGVVSNLNYAFRLINIPQAIFGVTIATLVFPILAEAKTKNDQALFRQGMERGLSFMFLFLVPTIAGMIFLMPNIVEGIYQRGAFTAHDTKMTSELSVYYIGSVLFYSIQIVIAKGFYTLQKGHLILRIGVLSIFLNMVFNFIFPKLMGAKGLAFSFSLVAFFYCSITAIILYLMSGGFNLKKIGKEWGKSIFAMIGMVVVLYIISRFEYLFQTYVYLGLMIAAGSITYFGLLFVFRTETLFQMIPNRKIKR